jgi:protein SMG5
MGFLRASSDKTIFDDVTPKYYISQHTMRHHRFFLHHEPQGFCHTAQTKNIQIKQTTFPHLNSRSIYSLVKTLDERKVNVTTIQDLFDPDVTELRQQLVQRCEILLFEDLEVVGKKSREIMWRKGYYDVITSSKKLWKLTGSADDAEKEHLQRLLLEGINRFKYIILNFERKFRLDLKLLLNFKLLNDVDETAIGRSVCPEDETMLDEWQRSLSPSAQKTEHYTRNEQTYTRTTIHALLISLGDLHRYYLDFGFARHFGKDDAAQFYTEAFKLEPGVGMAHNQLGTLLMGRNYDLDSVYHYLQSLVSSVPFELSENNVNNIFQQNAAFLEADAGDTKSARRNFMARLLLVIDVFFFDKEVTDFNALCQYVLMELKAFVQSEEEADLALFTPDLIYKIVASLFFCLLKLRAIGSKKVHSLNAFMVG